LFISTTQAENRSINEADVWRDDEASNATGIYGDIEFDAVNFTYPSRQDVSVLRNLCLVAREGQTTALVGSSGCGQSLPKYMYLFSIRYSSIGKSTCISLLLRHYEPLSGRINIGDRSITNFNVKDLRQNIGVVSQEPVCIFLFLYFLI
jgi:ATP-binding cassette subfamily B (MDR/TAP) protein 1